MSFVKQGLQDLSITRSTFDWGIPVPWDDDHVLYVWIDALLNYVTAAGYRTDPQLFKRVWPADVHLVGKDILRFHAVIWPAMLMAAGSAPAAQVFAHGWLLVGGEKMSKSKLTGIAPNQIIDTFGSDAFRYYFLRAIQFGSDGSFSWEHLRAVYTSELANGLGNLASRVAAMVGRYFGGRLPAARGRRTGRAGDRRQARRDRTHRRPGDRCAAIPRGSRRDRRVRRRGQRLRHRAGAVEGRQGRFARRAERLATILYTAAESLRAIAVLHNPVMPRAAASLWQQLGAERSVGDIDIQPLTNAGRWGILPPGSTVTKGEPLFPRIEEPDEP